MGTFQILALIVFAAFAVLAAVAWINNQRVRDELRQQGVTVQATVVDRQHNHHMTTDKNGSVSSSDSYSVSYRYTVDGVEYRSSEGVSFGTYEALAQGSPVEVVYLPGKPNEVRLASDL